jgi:hypothetical protein
MRKLFTTFLLLILLGISTATARGAINFIQEAHGTSGTTPATTFSVTYSGPAAAGNALITWVVVGNGCSTQTVTVADNVNGSWTAATNPQVDNTACSQGQWFYFLNARGGTTQVTATISTSEPAAMNIFEYSGITTATYDAIAGANFSGGTTITTPTVTTTGASDLILGAMGFQGSGGGMNFGTVTAASPYILRSNASQSFVAEQIAPSVGNTPGAQFTRQWGQPVEGVTVAFKAASSGSGGTATLVLCPNNGQTGNSANCAPSPTLVFGKQGTSTTSAALTISVNNCSTPNIAACNGTGSLTLGSPYYTITGGNAADFSNTGLGSCSNGLVITSGGNCTIVLQFTPSQASGTNESATLMVNSDSVGGPQTMSATGTSVTVTTISSCQALSGNTNYQLTANVSSPGTCFTVPSSNTDINLNGFTVTYCTSNQSTLVGGVLMTGWNVGNTTVHNGTINEGTGTCVGLAPTNNLFGAGAVIASSDGSQSSSFGTSVFNVTSTIKANQAKVLWEEGGATASSTVMHDVIYTDNDSGACGSVGCRAEDQYYPIAVSDARSAGPSQFYNITGTGGTQGAIVTSAPNSTFKNDFISPGNATSTNTNGFVFQAWGPSAIIQNNLTTGSGAGGSCLSCRGVQVSSVVGVVTGTVVQNNVLYTTNLNNNLEYGGCQIDGSFGMQINTAGSTYDLSNNTFQNNKVTVTSSVCPGFGFSWSGATMAQGPNKTIDNTFVCNLTPGSATGPCAGMRLVGNQYSPHPDGAVTGTGDTFLGDTSAIYIYYDGTPSWTCNQCTFGKGSNPIAGWVMLDYYGGHVSGASSNPMFLVDPTFTGGATKDSNNLQAWASNNASLSFSYTIQWTYTVTVKGATSGSPISGAMVTAMDSQGGQECSGTTNSSGVFSCVLNDTKYAAAGGSYTITNFNPFALQISATSCSTLNYNLSIASTTTETRQLGGC